MSKSHVPKWPMETFSLNHIKLKQKRRGQSTMGSEFKGDVVDTGWWINLACIEQAMGIILAAR